MHIALEFFLAQLEQLGRPADLTLQLQAHCIELACTQAVLGAKRWLELRSILTLGDARVQRALQSPVKLAESA